MSGFINNPSTLIPYVRGLLIKALNAEPQDGLGQFIETQSSTQRFEDFAVPGAPPMLRETIGDIQTAGMTDGSIRITPGEFLTKIVVKKADVEDDQLGLIQRRVRDVAQGAWRQRRMEIFRALQDTVTTWVDGAAYFADSHPARGLGAAYDNNLGGSGTTTANVITDLAAVRTALRTFQDEAGQPFNEDVGTIGIIVPPALEQPIRTAIGPGQVSGTNTVFAEGAKFVVVVDGRLTDVNDWYAFNLSGGQKPFVFVDRVGLEMEAFYKDFIWEFPFRARNRATLVHPQLGVRVVNS